MASRRSKREPNKESDNTSAITKLTSQALTPQEILRQELQNFLLNSENIEAAIDNAASSSSEDDDDGGDDSSLQFDDRGRTATYYRPIRYDDDDTPLNLPADADVDSPQRGDSSSQNNSSYNSRGGQQGAKNARGNYKRSDTSSVASLSRPGAADDVITSRTISDGVGSPAAGEPDDLANKLATFTVNPDYTCRSDAAAPARPADCPAANSEVVYIGCPSNDERPSQLVVSFGRTCESGKEASAALLQPVVEPWYGFDYQPTGEHHQQQETDVGPVGGDIDGSESSFETWHPDEQKKDDRRTLESAGHSKDDLFRLSSNFEEAFISHAEDFDGDETLPFDTSIGGKSDGLTQHPSTIAAGDNKSAGYLNEILEERGIGGEPADNNTTRHQLPPSSLSASESSRSEAVSDLVSSASRISAAVEDFVVNSSARVTSNDVASQIGTDSAEFQEIEPSVRRALVRFAALFWIGYLVVRYYCENSRTDSYFWPSTPSALCASPGLIFWFFIGLPAAFGTSFALVALYEITVRLSAHFFHWSTEQSSTVREKLGELRERAQEIAHRTVVAGHSVADAVQEAVSNRGSSLSLREARPDAANNAAGFIIADEQREIGNFGVPRDLFESALPTVNPSTAVVTRSQLQVPRAAADVPATIITTSQLMPAYLPNSPAIPDEKPDSTEGVSLVGSTSAITPPVINAKSSLRILAAANSIKESIKAAEELEAKKLQKLPPPIAPEPTALKKRIGILKGNSNNNKGDKAKKKANIDKARSLYRDLLINEAGGADQLRRTTTLRLSKESPTFYVPITIKGEGGELKATFSGVRLCKSEPNHHQSAKRTKKRPIPKERRMPTVVQQPPTDPITSCTAPADNQQPSTASTNHPAAVIDQLAQPSAPAPPDAGTRIVRPMLTSAHVDNFEEIIKATAGYKEVGAKEVPVIRQVQTRTVGPVVNNKLTGSTLRSVESESSVDVLKLRQEQASMLRKGQPGVTQPPHYCQEHKKWMSFTERFVAAFRKKHLRRPVKHHKNLT